MLKVFVYYNLHKSCWSIKALEGEQKGKVIEHAEQVILFDAKPKVSEAGRQRVLKEQSKNVHAGIVGNLFSIDSKVFKTNDKDFKEITYNPYKYSTFVYKDNDDNPFKGSDVVYMANRRVFEV